MNLQRYLQHEGRWAVFIIVALVLMSYFANVGVVAIDHGRGGHAVEAALPWVLEGTSHLGLLLMIPVVVWFERRVPIRLANWRIALPAHAAFSVVYAIGHVAILYIGRVLLFPVALGRNYHWDDWLGEFGYEYLKDFRSYLLILAGIALYRFILLRLQGEAGFVDDSPEPSGGAPADRFIVKKLGREFLVKVDDIEWIESAGNYVNLHVGGKVYPLRGTMTKIAEQLAPRGFVRVHRQAIVNLDRIREIRVFDSGDGTLTLDTDALVPLSRRYRQSLNDSARGGSTVYH